jgi:carbon storage regulator CsrA
MLVLSRKMHEKILFPGIQAAVAIVAIRGNTVRLGIEAPDDVLVLREEIHNRNDEPPVERPAEAAARERNHHLRNRLNGASLGLALLRKQCQLGMRDSLETTIDTIEKELKAMREHIGGAMASQQPCAAPKARKVRRALLVEDDQNERELLAAYLRMSGLVVETAGDGQDALDYLHTHERPDVVLMDMVLPRCDGPTAIREIRRDPAYAEMKIFAVTGQPLDRFGDRGRLGVDRWFNKPLDAEVLLRDLHRDFSGTD